MARAFPLYKLLSLPVQLIASLLPLHWKARFLPNLQLWRLTRRNMEPLFVVIMPNPLLWRICPEDAKKRTFDEISQEFGPDHWIWREGWSCEKGCSCWFCELWLGEIIDDCPVSKHQSNAPEDVTERD